MEGLRAVNAGSGFVAAIAGKLLADLGVTVVRAPATGRDPAIDFYPAYQALRSHETAPASALKDLLSSADICILGGEDFPDMPRDEDLAARLAGEHPTLILLDIQGYPSGSALAGRPAVDILVQARSGLVFEHYSERPNLMSCMPTYYGAAMQGIMGVLAAIFARGRNGAGQIVSTSLHEGALAWVTTWNEAERPDSRFHFVVPLDPRPLILKCADGGYVQIILGAVNAKYALYQVLGIEDPAVLPGDPGLPNKDDPPEKFYGDLDLLGPYIKRWQRKELIAALREANVAAEAVENPGVAWDDPQVHHNGLLARMPDGSQIAGCPIMTVLPEPSAVPRIIKQGPSAMPLAGLRIVDFGIYTAGPVSSLFLRKLGADVIKVEPITGDPTRNMLRAFMASNRGKRSLAVDMKSKKGRALVERLCASADIVTSNFRTGVAAKLGIDGETLMARHPDLIVLESPAFGRTGPRANETAFDLVLQAYCGFEVRAGGTGNEPLWNRTFLMDYSGGQLGAIGMLAALCHRQRTGQGSLVEVSLLNAAFFLQSEIIRRPDGSFAGADLLNAAQTGFRPAECLYQAAGGWLALAIRSEDAARALLRVLDIGGPDPSEWRIWDEPVGAAIAAAIRGRDVDALLSAFGDAGIWAEKCVPGMDHITLNDPLLDRLGIVERAPHSTYGMVSQIGTLYRLSKSAMAPPAPAPLFAEHTTQILRDLSFSDSEIAALHAENVIK